MNRNERPHLEVYYRRRANRYDVAAFEDANALHSIDGDMWTGAYAELICGDVEHMEAYNAEAGHKSEARAAYWRAILAQVEGAMWAVVAVATLLIAMV